MELKGECILVQKVFEIHVVFTIVYFHELLRHLPYKPNFLRFCQNLEEAREDVLQENSWSQNSYTEVAINSEDKNVDTKWGSF